MCDKRLSIIIPFYNVEQYIAQCLDSVYNQDIPEDEYEVICVDDCSPDNSITIVERYASLHSNLIIVRNNINRKLGGARNAGIDIAKGKYIWFVDSDDEICPNVLSLLCSCAEKDDLDVLHFNYELIPNSKEIDTNLYFDTEPQTGADLFFSKPFRWEHDFVTAWRKLYKRSFLRDNHILFAEHVMYEDNDYAFRIFSCAMNVRHIGLRAYRYRSNPDSITRMRVSVAHITYWLDLCHRLHAVKQMIISSRKDERFIPVLNKFISYEIDHICKSIKHFDTPTRKQTISIIRKRINWELHKYITAKKYVCIKLGLF